ncbi:MAG: sporulation initiation factor Spo0A C-terminal domain-containing protein [Ruminococcus sp.]|nr:sporulation initiation factor Spo0A C-terminal domain-containing protein [Ruminococcus sp.]
MQTKSTILLGGNGNTFEFLSQQLRLAGYNAENISSNPLEIQFESMTARPSAVFLSSGSDNIMVLIENLKRITNPPLVYIVQSAYEMSKNKKLEQIVTNYFTNPIDIKLIIDSVKDDMLKRDAEIKGNLQSSAHIHNVISESLHKLCVTPNYNGYMYLREAIKMAVLEPLNSRGFSTKIYPDIAYRYGVTPASIERNIRTAIIKSWEKASMPDKIEMFGAFSSNSKWHPTNSEFILIIADKINRELLCTTT